MSHAERCPVCGGTGKNRPSKDSYSKAVPVEEICHGCGGRGWVSVGTEYPPLKDKEKK